MSHRNRLSKSGRESGWISYPAYYWDQSRPPFGIDDIRFWRYCAERYGGPILDLCCGNGRYSIPLAELGYEVVGVDINEDMIALAKRRTEKRAKVGRTLRLVFQVADIMNLKLNRIFNLAIMPGWSFQVLLTQEDQICLLQRLQEHLASNGAFAFNLFIPFYRQQGLVEKGGIFKWQPDQSYHSGAQRTYDPISQIETLVESNIHPIKLRHTSLAELRLLFQLTGFEISELYGDDADMRPFTGKRSDDYTIIVTSMPKPSPHSTDLRGSHSKSLENVDP